MKAYIDQHKLTPKQSEPVSVEAPAKSIEQPVAPVVKQASKANHEHEIDYEDIELSNMRKVIAKRLVFSKVIY